MGRFVELTLTVVATLAACQSRSRLQQASDAESGRPAPAMAQPSTTVDAPAGDEWEQVGDGLMVRGWQIREGTRAHVVRVDLKRWELQSLRPERDADGGSMMRDSSEMGKRVHAAVVVNGGYFGGSGEVLGLRVNRGERWADLRKADWGVFFVQDGQAGLVHTEQARALGKVEFAVQCGPRLITEQGQMHLREGVARRTVIGVDGFGHVVLVATREAIGLNELTAAMAKPELDGGMGLVKAMNLDGGPSTQMHIPAAGSRWDISGSGVADSVAVVARNR